MSEDNETKDNDVPQFEIVKELEVNNSLVDQADAILEVMPDITESAIEQHENENKQKEETIQKYSNLLDADGNTFNPDLHQTLADGSPKTSAKTGKLLKRRGRKPGVKVKAHDSVIGSQSQPQSLPGGMTAEQQQSAMIAGQVSAQLMFTGFMLFGGEDFAPGKDAATGIDENVAISQAFGNYYISTGKTDIPPGAALALSVAMYALPRFTKPKVQTRVKSIGGKIYTWWQNRKLNKFGKGGKNGAQSNFRDDGKRQNDSSKKTG